MTLQSYFCGALFSCTVVCVCVGGLWLFFLPAQCGERILVIGCQGRNSPCALLHSFVFNCHFLSLFVWTTTAVSFGKFALCLLFRRAVFPLLLISKRLLFHIHPCTCGCNSFSRGPLNLAERERETGSISGENYTAVLRCWQLISEFL